MSRPAERLADYNDILAAPENRVAEIIDGQLYTQPRPAPKHAVAASSLGTEIGPPFHRGRGGPGGWWILDEPEVHLGRHVIVPDLAGWRRERMPALPETAWFELPPDWVCEVLSPSTARIDRIKKMRIYAEYGVAHAWLVDPLAQTLEVFTLEGGRWVLSDSFEEADEVRAVPFDAIAFSLGDLWA
jgi:Uma2 family endonuclease